MCGQKSASKADKEERDELQTREVKNNRLVSIP